MADDTGVPLGQRALFSVAGLVSDAAPVNGTWRASQSLMGVAWPIAGVYYSFDTTWTSHAASLADFAGVPGRKLYVTWQPARTAFTVNMTDIVAGVHDAHIAQMCAGMAAYTNGEVIVRWGHEMDGDWYPWSAAYVGVRKGCNTPAEYVAAWQYIATKVRTLAPAAKLFWCGAVTDSGAFTMEQYYPGDSYVDIVGYDYYNGYGVWRTPTDTWTPGYDRVTALHPTAPVWIGETGCSETATTGATPPGGKAEWAQQMFAETHFSRLKAINYFDIVGGKDWRFETSTPSQVAFAAGFQAMVNPSAIAQTKGVLPLSLETAPAFVPDALPLAGVAVSAWTDGDGHARAHSNLAYWLGRVIAPVSSTGQPGLTGEGNGFNMSLIAKATAVGAATVPIVRISTDFTDATKRALSLRMQGNVNDQLGIGMDGRATWGNGTQVGDTVVYRAAAGQLGTTGAVLFDGSVAAPGSNPAAGALVYGTVNALKARTTGLGEMNLTRRNWQDLYSTTNVLNGDPVMASVLTQPPAGFVHLASLIISETRTITNLMVEVTTAGSGWTAGQSFLALYTTAGVQLGITADVATVLSSAGARTIALTTPATGVTPQKLVIGILLNATTLPFLRCFPAAGNWDRTGINQRFVRAGGSALTAMPSPLDVGSLSGSAPTPFLCGVS